MIIIPTNSKSNILNLVFKDSVPNVDYSLRLFTNNVTPDPNSILMNFTEVSGLLYSAKLLPSSSFTVSIEGHSVLVKIANQTWTFGTGTPATIYGHYLTYTDGTTTYLMAAEKFNDPVTVGIVGDTLIVGGTIALFDGVQYDIDTLVAG
jgi:hypothetical protein